MHARSGPFDEGRRLLGVEPGGRGPYGEDVAPVHGGARLHGGRHTPQSLWNARTQQPVTAQPGLDQCTPHRRGLALKPGVRRGSGPAVGVMVTDESRRCGEFEPHQQVLCGDAHGRGTVGHCPAGDPAGRMRGQRGAREVGQQIPHTGERGPQRVPGRRLPACWGSRRTHRGEIGAVAQQQGRLARQDVLITPGDQQGVGVAGHRTVPDPHPQLIRRGFVSGFPDRLLVGDDMGLRSQSAGERPEGLLCRPGNAVQVRAAPQKGSRPQGSDGPHDVGVLRQSRLDLRHPCFVDAGEHGEHPDLGGRQRLHRLKHAGVIGRTARQLTEVRRPGLQQVRP